MSYRLIDANALNGVISNDDYEKVLNAPCIFADLPNGLDGEHYNLQEPKTGHWIKYGKLYQCSECKELSCCQGKFCNECGAQMIEPQERSE